MSVWFKNDPAEVLGSPILIAAAPQDAVAPKWQPLYPMALLGLLEVPTGEGDFCSLPSIKVTGAEVGLWYLGRYRFGRKLTVPSAMVFSYAGHLTTVASSDRTDSSALLTGMSTTPWS